jgi:hypothetical protein
MIFCKHSQAVDHPTYFSYARLQWTAEEDTRNHADPRPLETLMQKELTT